MIHVFQKVVTPEDCRSLVGAYKTHSRYSNHTAANHSALVSPLLLVQRSPKLCRRMLRVVKKCAGRIQKTVRRKLYLETCLIARMVYGDRQILHADAVELDGRPNHTPNRVHGAILYLNSTFLGGQIYFPYRLEPEKHQPKTGMLIAFPSDREFIHGVKHVEHGIRYSLPMWFVAKKKHVPEYLRKIYAKARIQ